MKHRFLITTMATIILMSSVGTFVGTNNNTQQVQASTYKNPPYSSSKWFRHRHVVTTKRVYAWKLSSHWPLIHPWVRKVAIPKGSHLFISKGGDSFHTWGLIGYVHVKGIGNNSAGLWIIRRAKTDWFRIE